MLVGIFMEPFSFIISILAGTAVGSSVDDHRKKFYEKVTNKVQEDLNKGAILILVNLYETNEAFIDTEFKNSNYVIERFTNE